MNIQIQDQIRVQVHSPPSSNDSSLTVQYQGSEINNNNNVIGDQEVQQESEESQNHKETIKALKEELSAEKSERSKEQAERSKEQDERHKEQDERRKEQDEHRKEKAIYEERIKKLQKDLKQKKRCCPFKWW